MIRGLLLLMCPALVASAGNAVVVLPVANLYAHASPDTEVVSQAILGANVEVLETCGDWARVRTPDSYSGWIERSHYRERETAWGHAAGTVEVASMYAHLYSEPSVTRRKPLLTAPFEARLEPLPGGDERWMLVSLPDGRTAWVQRGDVQPVGPPMDTSSMLAFSRRFLGLPYTWGGTSSFGYDCSGFTQMLERRRGIVMPRDAWQQAEWERAAAVEKANLEPGDLLYFGTPGKITHTGLYIGGGEFIHSTTHEKPVIQISKLEDEHWVQLYIGARRVR